MSALGVGDMVWIDVDGRRRSGRVMWTDGEFCRVVVAGGSTKLSAPLSWHIRRIELVGGVTSRDELVEVALGTWWLAVGVTPPCKRPRGGCDDRTYRMESDDRRSGRGGG